MNFSAKLCILTVLCSQTPVCALHTESISARLNQRCSSVTSPTVHIFHAACGVSTLQMENLSGSSSCSPSSPSTELCSNYSLLVVKTCASSVGDAGSILGQGKKDPTCPCRAVTWPKNGQNKFFLSRKPLPHLPQFSKEGAILEAFVPASLLPCLFSST